MKILKLIENLTTKESPEIHSYYSNIETFLNHNEMEIAWSIEQPNKAIEIIIENEREYYTEELNITDEKTLNKLLEKIREDYFFNLSKEYKGNLVIEYDSQAYELNICGINKILSCDHFIKTPNGMKAKFEVDLIEIVEYKKDINNVQVYCNKNDTTELFIKKKGEFYHLRYIFDSVEECELDEFEVSFSKSNGNFISYISNEYSIF